MITVKVVAPFAIKRLGSAGEVQIPPGTTLRRMLRIAGAPLYAHILPVMVNGWQEKASYRLRDGDLVVFVVPISGG